MSWSGGPIIRVQDAEGRGPYRPGTSRKWTDPNGFDCPPWWVELGFGMFDMAPAHAALPGGYNWGCGFSTLAQFDGWFTPREQRALERLGYRLVVIEPDAIAADTPRQILFGTRAPLTHVLSSFRLCSSAARDCLNDLPASAQHGARHLGAGAPVSAPLSPAQHGDASA